VLTASTSEAYAGLFKLLCEPGDQVLVRGKLPTVRAPAALEGVRATFYDLECHGCGASTSRALNGRLVHAHEPSSQCRRTIDRLDASPEDRQWLDVTCSTRELALVGDEVFGDYRLEVAPDAVTSMLDGEHRRR